MATRLRVERGEIQKVKSDLLIVNLFEGVKKPEGATGAVDRAARGLITRFLETGDFTGKLKETAVLYPTGGLQAKRVLLVGLGEAEKFDVHRARDVASRAVKKARDLGVKRAHTVIHGAGIGNLDPQAAAQALAEGAVLGTYKFTRYKGANPKAKDEKSLETLVVVERDEDLLKAAREGVRVGQIVGESTNYARDLATLSGADAAPPKFGDAARALARETGLKVQVFDRKKVTQLGMGGLLGVAQGSQHEPRFVILEHKPKKARGKPFVVVGKGITFDTGGISIKPSDRMEDMKFDKAGACATFGILRACALLDLPVHVIGLTAFAENMPSGSAYKPGDILTAMNGKTIEIINTDAEGRLVLADALSYAKTLDPAAVVEMSTLTGGIVIALGNQATGAFTNNAPLMEAVKDAAEATRERVWEMPMYEEYGEMVKSKVADVKNSAGRSASSITAAKFLENFVDYPWVHLDIAGTAWPEGSPGYNDEINPGFANGTGVRLLVHLLRHWEGLPSGEAPKLKTGRATRHA